MINKDVPFYKQWEFWILGIAVVILTIYQIVSNVSSGNKFEEIFNRLAEYEQTHVPLEEIKVEIPSRKHHTGTNNEFEAKIPLSYSGEKTATYFVEWKTLNSEGEVDNVAPLDNRESNPISTIKEDDGIKFEKKNYMFYKPDTYIISSTFYYYVGSDEHIGSTEEEIKGNLKNNKTLLGIKSRTVSFEVIVKESS